MLGEQNAAEARPANAPSKALVAGYAEVFIMSGFCVCVRACVCVCGWV